MKRKPSAARCRKHAGTAPQPVCRKCRLVQHRYLRMGRIAKPASMQSSAPPLALSNAVQAALANSWEALPERSKRALSASIASGRQGEEAALTDLARLLMDCAGVLFKRALTARHNRLRE